MGQIIQTEAQFGDRTSRGEAHLETDYILFRGDFRFKIRFEDISSVNANNGKLEISFLECEAIFHLGEKAEKWADKIKNPKSVIDKLGVKPSSHVIILGLEDKRFLIDLSNEAYIEMYENSRKNMHKNLPPKKNLKSSIPPPPPPIWCLEKPARLFS